MGLSLMVNQIVEPLKNTRLAVLAMAANFILVRLAWWFRPDYEERDRSW